MATVTEPVYTAQEYACLPDRGVPTELVKGKVVIMNVPAPRHGEICGMVAILVGPFVLEHRLGRVVTNDSGVITERGPDTVRGADVAFYSYARVPAGPFPQGYLDVVPELVFEVLSPTDRWSRVLEKVAEYLEAGVTAVCVLDPMRETVQLHRTEQASPLLHGDDELQLPDILGEFSVAVRRFFA